MNLFEMNGNWHHKKGKLKQKFSVLTDNDLTFAKGKEEEMLKRLATKLVLTKEQLHKLIAEL